MVSEPSQAAAGVITDFSHLSCCVEEDLISPMWSFMLSVKGQLKRHIIEEDEPIDKSGKYISWEEDDSMEFLRQTYSQDKNVSKILQVEEELHNLRQGNQDLSQYFATVKATYERLKFLPPPCKSCYKSHFELTMVAKFLAGLSPEYVAAKDQMLIGSEIPDLSDAYNRLSRLAISLSQPAGVTPASALTVGGGRSRGHGTTYSVKGRGIGHGTGGRGRFQCTYCGKIGHLEDRCWDKHGRLFSLSQGRNIVTKQGKSPTHSSMGSAQAATPIMEDSSSSIAPESVKVSIDKVEYEQFLAHKASQASTSTVLTDRAFSAGPSMSDSGTSWIIDSRASRHFCSRSGSFTTLHRFPQARHVKIADGILSPILSYGDDLQTGKTIGGGYEKGGVYILSAPMGLAATSSTSEPTFFQWRLRLGHSSAPKLCSLLPNLSVPESFEYISFAVRKLSQFMEKLRKVHWDAALMVLKYLKSSPGKGLFFKKGESLEVATYSDADYAGSVDDRRSTTGFCVFVGGNLISWRNKKQNVVSISSAESEYRAMPQTVTEMTWVKSMLTNMSIHVPLPIKMYCDN
ncbi:uncharacterized protein LOC116259523 [Nymphaea colorata]|nr:uncharacterized protein LOC116259523 [Nymphaea colorata]